MRVKFLGHVVSIQGMEVDPEKVSAIKNLPTPRNLKDVRATLGFVNYYRAHCANYSHITEPFNAMLRKGARFVWGPPQEKAFEELKKTFSAAPILGIIRDDGELVLDCDCSNFAMGIVLSQWQKEADSPPALRVLAYASKTLNDAQRNYCVTRRELTAIIFGLKHFRQYLLGRKFLIRSDHAALQYLKTKKEPTGQLARYLDLMAEYTFDIEHRAGKDHANADFLSRLPCEREGENCRQCHKAIKSSKRVQGAGCERGNVQKNPLPKRNESLSAKKIEAAPLHVTFSIENLKQKACETSGPPQENKHSLTEQPPTAEKDTERHKSVGDVPQTPTLADVNAVVTRAQSRSSYTGQDAEVTDKNNPHLENNSTSQPLRYRFNRRTVKDGLLVRTAPELDITEISNWSTDYLKQQQNTDPEISLAISWIAAKKRPEWDETKAFSPSLRSLWQQFDSLFIVNELLYRRFYTNDGIHSHFQFVLPTALKKEFLLLTHADAAGHLKLQKTLEHIQRRAWWYAWKRDAKVFISACRQCAVRHSGKTPRNAGMKALEVGAPCQRWAIDLCGPFRISDGYKYLFTAIDAYSKYVILQPIRNKEAETVAQAILDRIFYRWGGL